MHQIHYISIFEKYLVDIYIHSVQNVQRSCSISTHICFFHRVCFMIMSYHCTHICFVLMSGFLSISVSSHRVLHHLFVKYGCSSSFWNYMCTYIWFLIKSMMAVLESNPYPIWMHLYKVEVVPYIGIQASRFWRYYFWIYDSKKLDQVLMVVI